RVVAMIIEERGIALGGGRHQRCGGLRGIGFARLQQPNGAMRAEEMRQMQLRRADLVAERFVKPGRIRLGEFGGEKRRELDVAAEIEDRLFARRVFRDKPAIAEADDALREIAMAVARAVLLHHLQPGLAGELKKPGGARAARLDVALEAAFDARLCDQEAEIDAGRAARLVERLHDLRRQPMAADDHAGGRVGGHWRDAFSSSTRLMSSPSPLDHPHPNPSPRGGGKGRGASGVPMPSMTDYALGRVTPIIASRPTMAASRSS